LGQEEEARAASRAIEGQQQGEGEEGN
jgi:hypothetical protein